jgi:hypothetical protein
MINVHITNNVLLGQYFFYILCFKEITDSLSRSTNSLILFCILFQCFTNRFVSSVFLVRSVFLRSFYKVLLSYAILVGNLLGQNSLRIRKSTFYFLLTCPERAHSRLNTRASRTAISTPFNVFQYPFLPFLRLYPYNSVSRIRFDLLLS